MSDQIALTKKEQKQLAAIELTLPERFVAKVTRDFGSGVGEVALTKFQRRLAQNYFMAVDDALQKAEAKRLKKSGKYQDKVPVTWVNVNMESLSRNVVGAARIGLDPCEKNHISVVVFKNNNTGKYDIAFIVGYRGLELKAYKYGLDIPDAVLVEVVFSTDRFKAFKKDMRNNVESFEFETTNDFDRGEIVGGFYYHEFRDRPEKNKLKVFSLKDILKRKPQYASSEFWGGEKDEYVNGQKTGKKEQVDGWYEDMVRKTIKRAAYSAITIDSQKIDDDYMALSLAEQSMGIMEAQNNLQHAIETEANNGPLLEMERDDEPKTPHQGQDEPPAGVDPETGEHTKMSDEPPIDDDPPY